MSTHHLVVVSGSNKGFGKSIAKSYIKQLLKNQSHFIDLILLGRNEEQLTNTKTEIQTQLGNFGRVHSVDNVELSNIKDLKTKFEEISGLIKKSIQTEEYLKASNKNLALFNNAGSLGDISSKATSITMEQVQEYSNINLTSLWGLVAEFEKWRSFGQFTKSTLVNTSSLCAVQTFSYLSLYCTFKYARNALMEIVAKEHPDIQVLNYAPGPLNNEMQGDFRTILGDEEMRKVYQKLHDENQLVDMEISSDKLIDLIWNDKFKSGSHVDFYDN